MIMTGWERWKEGVSEEKKSRNIMWRKNVRDGNQGAEPAVKQAAVL